MFFCYSALESTAMLWASSYMALGKGIDKTTAAMWGSLFCIGITVGRLASGFLTMKLNDPAMIRLGQALVLTGIVIMLLPLPHNIGTIAGLMVIGLAARRSIRASSIPLLLISARTNRRPSSACRWLAPMWDRCACRRCSG
mgnify:CR=1 FL=1